MAAATRRLLFIVVVITAALTCLLLLVNGRYTRLAAALLLLAQVMVVAYLLRRTGDDEDLPVQSMDALANFDTTLLIGDETLPYLRQGLNAESAQKICEIIHKITGVDAVAITDENRILGFHGIGCRSHHQGGPILTGATKTVLDTGETTIVNDPAVLACDEEGCPHPLKSAVIAPLKHRGKVVGTFKLYRASPQPLPNSVVRLAMGIAAVLGLQMELAEADRHRQLVTKARLEALQAQIRPHFLFNVLNTIILFSRTDPERSRELLTALAQFFRRSLTRQGNFIPLKDEIEYINTYLSLEQARFGPRLEVKLKVDPTLFGEQVPILTLQPLVENAVVHGLAPAEEGGKIGVRVHRVGDDMHVLVADNGVGMEPERLRRVLEEGFGSNMGLGLTNVNDRLVSLYGERYRLRIRSHAGSGTAVRIRIPIGANLQSGD
ncbi:MAG: histidine kinase [Mycobacterium leprae]